MENPRHWRLKAQRYRLEGSTCPVCGRLTFPPRPFCPDCTTAMVRITGGVLPVVPKTASASIDPDLRYRIAERIPG